jgi:hypothetical protein
MSIFTYFNPHVVSYFFLVSPLVRVVQSYRRRVYLGIYDLSEVPWLFSCLGSGVAEWLLLGKANANGGPECVACLA